MKDIVIFPTYEELKEKNFIHNITHDNIQFRFSDWTHAYYSDNQSHKITKCKLQIIEEKSLERAYDFFLIFNKDTYIDTLKEVAEKCDINIQIEKIPELPDSGARREFESGAVRDISEGKGRCDLLPYGTLSEYFKEFTDSDEFVSNVFDTIETFKNTKKPFYLQAALQIFIEHFYGNDSYSAILEVSKHYEAGAKKYNDNNWKKGIPVHCYIDSATRHFLKLLRGDKDEPHERAFVWNILGALWTIQNKPELNDISN